MHVNLTTKSQPIVTETAEYLVDQMPPFAPTALRGLAQTFEDMAEYIDGLNEENADPLA